MLSCSAGPLRGYVSPADHVVRETLLPGSAPRVVREMTLLPSKPSGRLCCPSISQALVLHKVSRGDWPLYGVHAGGRCPRGGFYETCRSRRNHPVDISPRVVRGRGGRCSCCFVTSSVEFLFVELCSLPAIDAHSQVDIIYSTCWRSSPASSRASSQEGTSSPPKPGAIYLDRDGAPINYTSEQTLVDFLEQVVLYREEKLLVSEELGVGATLVA